MVVIYGLRCPIAGTIRYIGKSVNPVIRLRAHISAARTGAYNHHTSRWIRSLLSKDLSPELVLLCEVQNWQRWQEVEREFIASAQSRGWNLTNSTAGGEGLDFTCKKYSDAYRRNLSAAMQKMWRSPERKEENRLRIIAAWADEVGANKRRLSIRSAWKSPDRLARAKKINSEINSRPSVREKKSSLTKSSWDDPVVRAKRTDAINLAKPQMSASAKAWRHDPVKMGNWRASIEIPESKAKRKASVEARATPEYRAMMAERTRLSWDKRRAKKAAQAPQNEVTP